ncbi:class E sortase [Nocardioides sp. HDW12B]|nr:class E sortase [Nocardioides sp. HDW12B]
MGEDLGGDRLGPASPSKSSEPSDLSEPSEPADTPATPPAARPTTTRSPDRAAAPAPEPARSFLTVPALGLRDFPVVRYVGSPDDAPGTAIQNAGPMASPRGPAGGVGPGVVGNFLVTGHRTSHTMPFADLPSARAGDRVLVRSGEVELVYEITRTRWTSFRSPRSLAAQSAPVPGRPEQEATRPMITLSTCATPEDHARGNYWSDRFGNPEHRIDKIGVLVERRQVR